MLEILMTAEGRNKHQKLNYAFCFCDVYNRYGWVRLDHVNKHTKTGKSFPIIEYKNCKNIKQYISQFLWQDNDGYLRGTHKGKQIYQHRLLWELLKGPIPEHLEIDHINRNKKDNRIENLRLADKIIQSRNRNSKGKTGHKYISQQKGRNCYKVKIHSKYIGTYKTLKEALKNRDQYLIDHGYNLYS